MTTPISRLSKPDTVVLLDAAVDSIFVDHGQYRTDLVDGPPHFDLFNKTRCAITTPREVSIVVRLMNTDEGVLVEHGDGQGGSNFTYRVTIDADGLVRCLENGTQRLFGTLPGIDDDLKTFMISWCTRPTPGDASSIRSELLLYNLDDGEAAVVFATHGLCTTNASWLLWVNGTDATLPIYSDTADRIALGGAVRIGRRFHSQAEQYEDWVAERTPPATTQLRRGTPLALDRASLDVANDGSFAGPCHLWAGHAFEQSDRRLVGALVNLRVLDPLHVTDDFEPEAWWRAAPGDAAVKLCTSLLWCRPVPAKVNRARVRLFVRQTIELGMNTAEVRYRCYSIAGLPVADEPVGPLTYYRTAAATCDTNHGSGAGESIDLGALPLAVDSWGMSWLAVGIEFDESDPDLASDTNAFVRAVTIEPYFEPAEGGLDVLEP